MHDDWPSMVDLLEPQEQGEVRVEHYEVTEHDAMMASMRGQATQPGKICTLHVGKVLMMSDTMHEQRTCTAPVWNGNGHLLIAGLGLGWIIHPIMKRGKVTKITIIEKSQDVIDVIAPTLAQYGDVIEIICADIFEWKPPKGVLYDSIWFDIWPDICTDNLAEITRLNRKFARRLNRENPKAWRGAWCESRLRYYRDRDRRSGW